jgi:hypothetical protein
MSDPSGSTEGSAGVVLLVPEALGETADLAGVRRTLAGPPRAARGLLCLVGNAGHELAATVAELGLDLQILVAAAAQPAIKEPCSPTPPDMSEDDQTKFALALCDVVLVAPGSNHPVAHLAEELEKTIAAPGDPLPKLAQVAFVHGLDPESSGWRILRRINGRLEQAINELLAFGWSGWNSAGRGESTKALRKCIAWGRLPTAWFPPDESPDRAVHSSASIVAAFEEMDRSAVHGSYIQRDIAWFTYIGAAVAVFAAVAGVFRHPGVWVVVELAALLAVFGAVFWARAARLQDRWTACRFVAEQLRIARMSLPLLVLPPALATADTGPAEPIHTEDHRALQALAKVKRVVRDQGLPQLISPFSAQQAAEWVQLIVRDKLVYHRRNHRKLERAEARLRGAAQLFFYLALAAVILHLGETFGGWHLPEGNWVLMATVVGPAFAAALHGAATRLGIVHRAGLSKEMEKELETIEGSLISFVSAPRETPEGWREVRRLAYEAANAMGREHTSWHGLVQRHRDELP